MERRKRTKKKEARESNTDDGEGGEERRGNERRVEMCNESCTKCTKTSEAVFSLNRRVRKLLSRGKMTWGKEQTYISFKCVWRIEIDL